MRPETMYCAGWSKRSNVICGRPTPAAGLAEMSSCCCFPGRQSFRSSETCDRIRREIGALPAQGFVVRSPTVSFLGIARADAGSSRSEIMARADRSLYAAKQAGRNCARISSFARTSIQAEVSVVSEESTGIYLRHRLSSMLDFHSVACEFASSPGDYADLVERFVGVHLDRASAGPVGYARIEPGCGRKLYVYATAGTVEPIWSRREVNHTT